MKYYLIAGEASGDMHGAHLMKAIKEVDPEADFRFWGGDLMKEQGGTLVKHYKDHAVMGFVAVIQNLGTIRKNFRICREDMQKYQPDAAIFIDYSGFNLRMAKFAKTIGLRTFYYVAPQVWAWRKHRIKSIKKYLDRVFAILPFEVSFYEQHNYPVDFVGNPLIDIIAEKQQNLPGFEEFIQKNSLSSKPVIALLPGSRKQEISTMLPLMLATANTFPHYQFVIAGAPAFSKDEFLEFAGAQSLNIVFGQTYDLLKNASAAAVTSGTATLETALFNIPQVVCYKMGGFSFQILKRLIKIKYISLVNLIMDREVVKELIQDDLGVESLTAQLTLLLQDSAHRQKMLNDYQEMRIKLGKGGAARKAARLIYEDLNGK